MEAASFNYMFAQIDTSSFMVDMAEGLQLEGAIGKDGVGADKIDIY